MVFAFDRNCGTADRDLCHVESEWQKYPLGTAAGGITLVDHLQHSAAGAEYRRNTYGSDKYCFGLSGFVPLPQIRLYRELTNNFLPFFAYKKLADIYFCANLKKVFAPLHTPF